MSDYVIAPYTIAVDNREQMPFQFVGYKTDARQGYKPLIIPTQAASLKTGDYSLVGFEDRISCERKSMQDAFSTFCQGRERFERELERLNAMEFAGVVIESSWPTILHKPPEHTKFSPKSFFRSVIAWNIRYPRVHFWCCETRSFAERVTLRWLERWWADDQQRKKEVQ